MKCLIVITILIFVILGLSHIILINKYKNKQKVNNIFVVVSMFFVILSFCFGIKILINKQNIETFVCLLIMFLIYLLIVHLAKDGFEYKKIWISLVRFILLFLIIHYIFGNVTNILENKIDFRNILISRSIVVIIICCLINIIMLFTSKISCINEKFINSTTKVYVTFYLNYMIYIYMIQIKNPDLTTLISCIIVCFSVILSFFDKIEDIINYFTEPILIKNKD